MTFDDALAVLSRLEGGVANNPDDPGGLTVAGVTAGTWRRWLDLTHQMPRPVTASTEAERRQVYRDLYWDRVRADALPHPVGLVVFDGAVNQGAEWMVSQLQRLVGTTRDGVVGPITAAAARAGDPYWLAEQICWVRLNRYVGICREWERDGKPRPWTFLDGWRARLVRLREAAGLSTRGLPA